MMAQYPSGQIASPASQPAEASPLEKETARAAEVADNALACVRELRSRLRPALRECGPEVADSTPVEPPTCDLAGRIQEIRDLSLETLRVVADIQERLQL